MTTTDRVEERAKRTTLWYDLVQRGRASRPRVPARAVPLRSRKDTQVPVERYTSREYHLLEREHLWRRVWQMACREENLPEVG